MDLKQCRNVLIGTWRKRGVAEEKTANPKPKPQEQKCLKGQEHFIGWLVSLQREEPG